MIGNKY